MQIRIPTSSIILLLAFTILIIVLTLLFVSVRYSPDWRIQFWMTGWGTIVILCAYSLLAPSHNVDIFDGFSVFGFLFGSTLILDGCLGKRWKRLPKWYYGGVVGIGFIYFFLAYSFQPDVVLFYTPLQVYSGSVWTFWIYYVHVNDLYHGFFRNVVILTASIFVATNFLLPVLLILPELFGILITAQALSLIVLGIGILGLTLVVYERDLKTQTAIAQILGSIIQHDIRNYLQGAMQCLELAKIDSDKHNLWMLPLEESLENALTFVEDMRDLASQLARHDRHLESLNLLSLVDEAVSILKRTRDLTKVNLEISIPSEIEIMTNRLVRQIFLNILDNALKQKTDFLKIAATSNHTIVLVIEDHAGGVASELLDFINDEGITDFRKAPGKGLGLILIKGLARLCGVTMHLENILDNEIAGCRWTLKFEKSPIQQNRHRYGPPDCSSSST